MSILDYEISCGEIFTTFADENEENPYDVSIEWHYQEGQELTFYQEGISDSIEFIAFNLDTNEYFDLSEDDEKHLIELVEKYMSEMAE